jgi:phenylpropionate dioxygenase-like ring-hydroxylating dioxygenase large terminal subunit
MLPKELNELLTRTGPGTRMGELIRRYWVPALLSEEIPKPDCPPVQVRLLGEELVAFRDSEGRIGLLEEHCLHRGTSLYYGRNEECGLRCIYHGWKYDVAGRVLDTPAEPAGSTFKDRLRHTAYPTHEAAGMVFAYLGPPDQQPLFPNYEWALLPSNRVYVTKSLLECNYLQGLEGECDSSHLSILHSQFNGPAWAQPYVQDTAPAYETEDTDFGVRMVALRKAGPEQTYVRVSSFVVPVACWIPALNREVHFYVPADDTHAWRYDLGMTTQPVQPDEVRRAKVIGPDYRRLRTPANHYLQDRAAQRTVNFTGIVDDAAEGEFLAHDACATESMGPLYDRSREHLGVSDKGVIAVRRYLIDVVQAFQAVQSPPHLVTDPAQNHFEDVDTFAATIPAGASWRERFPHLANLRQPARQPV